MDGPASGESIATPLRSRAFLTACRDARVDTYARVVICYDAFELIGTTFRVLDWKTLVFFERAVPISPNTW